MIAGSAYVEFGRRNFPEAIVVEERNWDAAIDSLLGGRVDALYRGDLCLLAAFAAGASFATIGASGLPALAPLAIVCGRSGFPMKLRCRSCSS